MSAVTESKYTRKSNAIIDAETHPELREALEELRALTKKRRREANRLTGPGCSEQDRKKAKRLRLQATRLEKTAVELHDFRCGLGEWAPGGKYATPEYLARREFEEVSA